MSPSTAIEMCCSPLFAAPVSDEEAEELAARLRVLADPSRLRIMSLIAEAGELCGCDLTEPLGLSQPTVSHHLKQLAEAGFVEREQRGKWAWYRVDPAGVDQVAAALAVPAR